MAIPSQNLNSPRSGRECFQGKVSGQPLDHSFPPHSCTFFDSPPAVCISTITMQSGIVLRRDKGRRWQVAHKLWAPPNRHLQCQMSLLSIFWWLVIQDWHYLWNWCHRRACPDRRQKRSRTLDWAGDCKSPRLNSRQSRRDWCGVPGTLCIEVILSHQGVDNHRFVLVSDARCHGRRLPRRLRNISLLLLLHRCHFCVARDRDLGSVQGKSI